MKEGSEVEFKFENNAVFNFECGDHGLNSIDTKYTDFPDLCKNKKICLYIQFKKVEIPSEKTKVKWPIRV